MRCIGSGIDESLFSPYLTEKSTDDRQSSNAVVSAGGGGYGETCTHRRHTCSLMLDVSPIQVYGAVPMCHGYVNTLYPFEAVPPVIFIFFCMFVCLAALSASSSLILGYAEQGSGGLPVECVAEQCAADDASLVARHALGFVSRATGRCFFRSAARPSLLGLRPALRSCSYSQLRPMKLADCSQGSHGCGGAAQAQGPFGDPGTQGSGSSPASVVALCTRRRRPTASARGALLGPVLPPARRWRG